MKKRITVFIIALALTLMSISFSAFAADEYTVRSQDELKQALEEAKDGDVINIDSVLSLNETIVFPAKRIEIRSTKNINSTAALAFRVSEGADVSFRMIASTVKVASGSAIFENNGDLWVDLSLFGTSLFGNVDTTGQRTEIITNSANSSLVLTGGNYRGKIVAEEGADVTVSALGGATFAPKPDDSFLESGCRFVDPEGDGIWVIDDYNTTELQYNVSDSRTVCEKYVELGASAEREKYVVDNGYQSIKHQLLLDYEGDAVFTEDTDRTVLLNDCTVTGDITVSKGSLSLVHGNTEAEQGKIAGKLLIENGASASISAGVIDSVHVEEGASLTVTDTASCEIKNLALSPNAELITASGTIENSSDVAINIALSIENGAVTVSLSDDPTVENECSFEGWSIIGTTAGNTTFLLDGNIEITAEWTAHEWRYEASNNTVKAYCPDEDCVYHTGLYVTVSASGTVWNQGVCTSSVTNEISEVTGYELSEIIYESVDGKGYSSTVIPTEVGQYRARVTINGYSASAYFSIIRVQLLDLTLTVPNWRYGGIPSTPQLEGNLGNGAVSYYYKPAGADDSEYTANVPDEVGDYVIKAVVAQSDSYTGGETTAEFSIVDADMSSGVSASGYEGIYDGEFHYPTVTVPEGATVEYMLEGGEEYTAEPIGAKNAGTLVIYYKVSMPSYEDVLGSVTMVIAPKQVKVVWDKLELVYNGKEQTPTAHLEGVLEGEECSFSISGTAVNVGKATASVSELANSNYALPDDTSTEFTVNPLPITGAVATLGDALRYNGAQQTQTVSGVTLGEFVLTQNDYTVLENVNTDAGAYKLVIKGIGNFTGEVSVDYSIAKAVYDMSAVTLPSREFVYDVREHSTLVLGKLPAGVTVSYPEGAFTSIGKHTAVASFTGDAKNYEPISDITAEVVIKSAELSAKTKDSLELPDVVVRALGGFDPSLSITAQKTRDSGADVYNVSFLRDGASCDYSGELVLKILLPDDFGTNRTEFFLVENGEKTAIDYTVDGDYAVIIVNGPVSIAMESGDVADSTLWIPIVIASMAAVFSIVYFVYYKKTGKGLI